MSSSLSHITTSPSQSDCQLSLPESISNPSLHSSSNGSSTLDNININSNTTTSTSTGTLTNNHDQGNTNKMNSDKNHQHTHRRTDTATTRQDDSKSDEKKVRDTERETEAEAAPATFAAWPYRNHSICGNRFVLGVINDLWVYVIHIAVLLVNHGLFIYYTSYQLGILPIRIIQWFLFAAVLASLLKTTFTDAGMLPKQLNRDTHPYIAPAIYQLYKHDPGMINTLQTYRLPPQRHHQPNPRTHGHSNQHSTVNNATVHHIDVATADAHATVHRIDVATADAHAYPQPFTSHRSIHHNLPSNIRICGSCFLYRTPNIVHCRECDACIDGFDHHCVFVAADIGSRNYRSFVLFLSSTLLYALYVCVVCAVLLVTRTTSTQYNIQNDVFYTISQNPVTVAQCIFTAIISLFLLSMWLYHMSLISKGITTNIDIKRNRLKAHKRHMNHRGRSRNHGQNLDCKHHANHHQRNAGTGTVAVEAQQDPPFGNVQQSLNLKGIYQNWKRFLLAKKSPRILKFYNNKLLMPTGDGNDSYQYTSVCQSMTHEHGIDKSKNTGNIPMASHVNSNSTRTLTLSTNSNSYGTGSVDSAGEQALHPMLPTKRMDSSEMPSEYVDDDDEISVSDDDFYDTPNHLNPGGAALSNYRTHTNTNQHTHLSTEGNGSGSAYYHGHRYGSPYGDDTIFSLDEMSDSELECELEYECNMNGNDQLSDTAALALNVKETVLGHLSGSKSEKHTSYTAPVNETATTSTRNDDSTLVPRHADECQMGKLV